MESDKFEINLEYPVSVEAILSLSFNSESFKLVFDFILDVLRKHEAALTKTSTSMQDKISLKDAEDLLEAYKHSINSRFSDFTDRLEKLENNFNSHQTILDLHENFIKEILPQISMHQVELSKHEKILDVFRQDMEQYSTKVHHVENNVLDLKETTENNKIKINDHEKRLRNLEAEIKQALNAIKNLGGEIENISKPESNIEEVKVIDSSTADRLSESIKDLLNQIRQLENRIKTAEEAIKIQSQLLEKSDRSKESLENDIKRLEDLLKRLGSDKNIGHVESSPSYSNDIINSIKNSISNLQDLMNSKSSHDDLQKIYNELNSRIDTHDTRLSSIDSILSKKADKSEIQQLINLINEKISSSERVPSKPDESFDTGKLTGISRRLGYIEEALKKLALPEGHDLISLANLIFKLQSDLKENKEKSDKDAKVVLSKFKDLEDQLNKKVGLDKFKEVTDDLYNRLKLLAEEFDKKFAEKIETKRALTYLGKIIKEFTEMKAPREGEDAMLARKPLGGWSCASCQKDLEKLMGKIAPYQAWNKLPYRDPADRIARAGPGFSRMLATVQPDLLNNRAKNSANVVNSPQYSHIEEEAQDVVSFPPVKKQVERPNTSL